MCLSVSGHKIAYLTSKSTLKITAPYFTSLHPSACQPAVQPTSIFFLLLLSLVNTTHLPTQTDLSLVKAVVCRGTSARLAAFDWSTPLFFSSASRRWVGGAVSPVWHVPSQILHGVKLDPLIFHKTKHTPSSVPCNRLYVCVEYFSKFPPDTS